MIEDDYEYVHGYEETIAGHDYDRAKDMNA
jgi:hypothetical protein